MTSRMRLLVAVGLCAAFSFTDSALAQADIRLRASYQGAFLAEGTEIVVLTEPGRHIRDGRYQPEFFPARDFPRTSSGTPRRDRLDATGHSNRSYAATQESGRLYFIYALTPDSTLYWSYSALRDSLKYDVVSTGVMSVAPVPSAEVRDAVMRTFFRPRVRVVMRGEGEAEAEVGLRMGDRSGDYADGANDLTGLSALNARLPDPADSENEALRTDNFGAEKGSEEQSGGGGPEATSDQPTSETADEAIEVEATTTNSDLLPVVSASQVVQTERAGVTVPPLLAWSLLALMLAAVAVPVYLVREARNELKKVRREMIALRGRMAAGADAGAGDESAGTTQRRTGQGDRHDPDPDSPWK